MRDASLEIVLETGERTGQDVGVIGAEAGRQLTRNRARGRLIAGGSNAEAQPGKSNLEVADIGFRCMGLNSGSGHPLSKEDAIKLIKR